MNKAQSVAGRTAAHLRFRFCTQCAARSCVRVILPVDFRQASDGEKTRASQIIEAKTHRASRAKGFG
jgi:hypothetical protein